MIRAFVNWARQGISHGLDELAKCRRDGEMGWAFAWFLLFFTYAVLIVMFVGLAIAGLIAAIANISFVGLLWVAVIGFVLWVLVRVLWRAADPERLDR